MLMFKISFYDGERMSFIKVKLLDGGDNGDIRSKSYNDKSISSNISVSSFDVVVVVGVVDVDDVIIFVAAGTDDTGDKNGIPFGLTLTLRPSRSNSFSNIRNVLQIITERCNDRSVD
ncbi:hypothetical protein DERP_003038 [Dermatophagoides pteronyssinus]|uniref:Uncharacterized protein n=1 Tax=Dermatophagoides pteronyssinus TaxID=6956 RepID=A0ABQ8JIC7_DERPT|nr:hypothetical protein DERP_003038 [Dermatophagoides pteronyssinus]